MLILLGHWASWMVKQERGMETAVVNPRGCATVASFHTDTSNVDHKIEFHLQQVAERAKDQTYRIQI